LDHTRTVARFNQGTARLATRFGYSWTAEGRTIVEHHIQPLTDFIAGVRKKCPPPRKRPQPSLTPDLWRRMSGVPNAVLATAVFQGAINAIWSRDMADPSRALKARLAIGWEIWRQCRGAALSKRLAAKITKGAARKGSMQAREIEERKLLHKHGIKFPRWSADVLAHAGNWGFDCLLRALPHVFYELDGTPELFENVLIDPEALWHPVHSPLSSAPAPWTDFEAADGTPFVRNARDETAIRLAMVSGQMRKHVDAVNKLQSVAWMINEPVLAFVKDLARDHPRFLKKVKSKGDWTALRLDLDKATSLVARPFWIRQNVDFRGRIYPLAHFNFQRTDHIRGLFRFANGAPITKDGIRWLKTHCANTFNQEKLVSRRTFDERIAWTEEHIGAIEDVAANPMSRLVWLGLASDPIQFVAACIELVNALREGVGFVTALPISFDASCSGAQHYSLLARHSHGARLTNLDSDYPECIYGAVRDRVAVGLAQSNAHEAGWWTRHRDPKRKIDRSLLKTLVMTYFYGSEEGGQRLKIYDILRERGVEQEKIDNDAVNCLLRLVRKSIERELSGGAPEIMRWLRTKATDGAGWKSPSGLPIRNQYNKAKTKVPQLYLGDKVRRFVTAVGYGKFDPEKAANAIAPNMVHSLDAAHQVLVVNACPFDLFTIHDSFGCLACHADKMHAVLRNELVNMYTQHDPLVQLGADLPPRGDLDLELVRHKSPYAFA
jgi:DNA-directed RNA polymerase